MNIFNESVHFILYKIEKNIPQEILESLNLKKSSSYTATHWTHSAVSTLSGFSLDVNAIHHEQKVKSVLKNHFYHLLGSNSNSVKYWIKSKHTWWWRSTGDIMLWSRHVKYCDEITDAGLSVMSLTSRQQQITCNLVLIQRQVLITQYLIFTTRVCRLIRIISWASGERRTAIRCHVAVCVRQTRSCKKWSSYWHMTEIKQIVDRHFWSLYTQTIKTVKISFTIYRFPNIFIKICIFMNHRQKQ